MESELWSYRTESVPGRPDMLVLPICEYRGEATSWQSRTAEYLAARRSGSAVAIVPRKDVCSNATC